MNAVDLCVLVLLSLCAIRGFVRGVFRESVGLVGFALGAAAAMLYWRQAAEWLRHLVTLGPVVEQIAAAIGIFILVNLLAHVAAVFLERMARAAFLSTVMRLAGVVVGVGKGAVVLGVVLLVLRTYPLVPGLGETIDASFLGSPLAEGAAAVLRSMLGPPEGQEA